MPSLIIGGMESIGAVAFVVSALWGIHNARNEVPVTEFWMVYAGASIAGSLFSVLKAAEWFGIAPTLADQLQPPVGIIFATILLVTAIICAVSPVERAVK